MVFQVLAEWHWRGGGGFTAGKRGSLSLIKQSGMTNKIVVVQLLPWVSQ